MSILNNAFDSLTPLYNSLGEEVSNSIEPIFDEPLYIEHSTMSGVEERPLFKRTQSMRMSSTLLESLIEEEEESSEIENFIPFMAKITGALSTPEANKWYYSWEEMRYSGINEGTYSTIVPRDCGSPCQGTASNAQTRALNIMEWGNNNNYVAPGVCLGEDAFGNCDYPEGWELQPIGAYSQVIPIVIMYRVRPDDTSMVFRYIFQAENDHDGTCVI